MKQFELDRKNSDERYSDEWSLGCNLLNNSAIASRKACCNQVSIKPKKEARDVRGKIYQANRDKKIVLVPL